jgi:ubiquinone/menaquinone biosynthesis C-methylase UbiE
MAQAFDELADSYDDDHHDVIARALIALVMPAREDRIADVACGSGAVALAVAQTRPPAVTPILAVDLSAKMIAAGRARAEQLGHDRAIEWRVEAAVPLPVADSGLDLILCASSLHFLGIRALSDWRRALRPGGRVGFTLPMASRFRPSGRFADLVADDLPLPQTSSMPTPASSPPDPAPSS